MKLRGNNELRLNGATMVDIVQEWLTRNTQGHHPPTVGSVTHTSNPHTFVIGLVETEPEIKEDDEDDLDG